MPARIDIPPPPEGDYGPKFRALSTNGQKRFVLALAAQHKRDYCAAYTEAGYVGKSHKALTVDSHRLAHDTRIQEALQEEAGRRVKALLPMALHVVEAVLEDPQHKDAVKVAHGILDRSGLGAVQEVKHTLGLAGDTEMLARIKLLAERNGIPIETLLGNRMAKMIDVTPRVPVQEEEDPYADEEY